MQKSNYVPTIIDGIQLNSRHFSAMTKENAINAMVKDKVTEDRKWAGDAYDKMVDDVKNADAKLNTTAKTPVSSTTGGGQMTTPGGPGKTT